MKCQCHNCKASFEAEGSAAFEVLTGGKDCPECGTKCGIDIVIAERKGKK